MALACRLVVGGYSVKKNYVYKIHIVDTCEKQWVNKTKRQKKPRDIQFVWGNERSNKKK